MSLLGALDKISSFGRIIERGLALCGKIINVYGAEIAQGPTCLETALVVVGDPFSPSIYTFSPEKGTAGRDRGYYWRAFFRPAENNNVYFWKQKSRSRLGPELPVWK